MGERAEQLVLEYLRRVADAAHGVLRADHRVAFVARLRTRIDELRAGATDPEAADKVIARFGDPVRLVERERERLARAEVAPAATAEPSAPERPAPEPSVSGSPVPGFSAPEQVPTAGDGPSTDPIPVIRAADEAQEPRGSGVEQGIPGSGEDAFPPTQPYARVPEPSPDQPPAQAPAQPSTPAAPEPAAKPYVRPSAGPSAEPDMPGRHGTVGHIRPVPGRPSTPQAHPTHTGPPLYKPPSSGRTRVDWSSAGSRLFGWLPSETRAEVREHVLPPIAVAFLGVGGLLLPFPLWLVGAVLVLLSTEWPRRDQLLGMLIPIVILFVGAGGFAGFDEKREAAGAYGHALVAHGLDLFRVGAVLGAAYLAWRIVLKARAPGPPGWQQVRSDRGSRTQGFQ